MKNENGLVLLPWPSKKVLVPNLIQDFMFYLDVTIDERLKFRSSTKTLKVQCGPKSTEIIQSDKFLTKVTILKNVDKYFEFENFETSNV